MRVLIVDDHALFRDGLRALLESRGVDVVAEGENGRQALDLARTHRPDIVLMDLDMPEMRGVDATRILTVDVPESKVVILTASEDDADLFEAIKSGAQGYLFKNLKADQLMSMLEAVERGEPGLTPALARKLLTEFARPPAVTRHERASDELTEREREVLELLVQGITSNRDLAERLIVTENTVKYHLRNILDKLHLQNRAQVVGYALRTGLVDPSRLPAETPDSSPSG
jgi:DNA-binding NarL/FixJ family response regulator